MRRFVLALTVAALPGSPVLAQTTSATPTPVPVSTATTPILLGGQLTTPSSYLLSDLQAQSLLPLDYDISRLWCKWTHNLRARSSF